MNFEGKIIAELKKKDKLFANIDLFEQETKKREENFVSNNIKGIIGYIENK